MLTDSGGFQVFSLSKLRKVTADGGGVPVAFGWEQALLLAGALDGCADCFLGADIAMVFDECVETPASWERTRESMGLTHAWARRSKDHLRAIRSGAVVAGLSQIPLRARTAFEGETQSLFGMWGSC